MKFLVVLSVVVACVAADVAHLNSQAPIVRYDNEINLDNSYNYAYETGNKIYAQETGDLKKVGEYPTLSVSGSYGYQSKDGLFELSYTADENGFQPKGAHLPVGPEIPAYIIRSLEYIRAHPVQEKKF